MPHSVVAVSASADPNDLSVSTTLLADTSSGGIPSAPQENPLARASNPVDNDAAFEEVREAVRALERARAADAAGECFSVQLRSPELQAAAADADHSNDERYSMLELVKEDLAVALNGAVRLAAQHKVQGEYDTALNLYNRLLTLFDTPDDANRLTLLNNTAEIYRQSGDAEQAIRIQRNILAVRQQSLGPTHPLTLNSMHNLVSPLQGGPRPVSRSSSGSPVFPFRPSRFPTKRARFAPTTISTRR